MNAPALESMPAVCDVSVKLASMRRCPAQEFMKTVVS